MLRNKKYILLIVILFLIYCANKSNTTIIDKMLELGATNTEIGYKWTIQGWVQLVLILKYFMDMKKNNW